MEGTKRRKEETDRFRNLGTLFPGPRLVKELQLQLEPVPIFYSP